MFSFEILKKSEKSVARLGLLKTSHGNIETPAFVFFATKGSVKGVSVDKIKEAGTQAIILNAYHLSLRPGVEIIKNAGGAHKFMGFERPIFANSGGFQISGLRRKEFKTLLALEENGAKLRSYIDGKIIDWTPELSIKTQIGLGADVIIPLDERVSYRANKLYVANSMERSQRWALMSLNALKCFGQGKQALLAIIQGGIYKDLRAESVRFANENDFDGFAIGGFLGRTKSEKRDVIAMTSETMRKEKYVHLLNVGEIEDIFNGIESGIDAFSWTTPTKIARHGTAIVKRKESADNSKNYLNLRNASFKEDYLPISPSCNCYACRNFSRAYIRYLLKADETLGGSLISIHNIHAINELMSDIRITLKTDSLETAYKEWL